MPDLRALLWPKSVAVVGASNDQTSLRGRIVRVMRHHAFAGTIYPISRSEQEIQGLPAHGSVGAVPEKVDLAILIVPARYVPAALEECGQAGVKAAHIIASGFAEEAGEGGAALQTEIRAIARQYDMAVGGPNSVGFANFESELCATFSPVVDGFDGPLMPPGRETGHVAVIAQSGGLGFSFYDRGRPKEIPFSLVMTTGNEACLTSLDLLDHMLEGNSAEVFILFLEDIKNPDRLAAVAEKALRAGKPLIAAKIGQSEAGRRAALSHTAALAGSAAGWRAMCEHYGIMEGGDIDRMVDLAQGFSRYIGRLPKGNRVGIFTPSGGAGGWMADTCAAAGLSVPQLDDATRADIAEHLPSYGSSGNPVDVTAQAIWKVGHARLAQMVARSETVDSVIVVTSAVNAGLFQADGERLRALAEATEKPILFCSYTTPKDETAAAITGAGYPLYTSMPNCAATMAEMARYRSFRERFLAPEVVSKAPAPDRTEVSRLLNEAGPVLCEYEALAVLKAHGITVPDSHLARSEKEAAALAPSAGEVAMKVQSPDIPHKTEAGGVMLGVEPAAAGGAFLEIVANARAYAPEADIRGVLVQPMAGSGVEMIVGVTRDETYGPMLMVGLGGVFAEHLGDVALAPVPIDAGAARTLLDGLKGRAVLDGARGAPAADIDALVALMVALSRLAAEHAEVIEEIDLNPVIVHAVGEGVTVADALMVKRG
jgi:acyl-CoA synthetase (NDP forming)